MILIFLLGACRSNATNEIPQLIEVEINIQPTEVKLNTEATLQAVVSIAGKEVNDANEVLFEIWKDGEEESENINATKSANNGVYSIKKTFAEQGTYIILAHVTARSLHTVQKAELEVK